MSHVEPKDRYPGRILEKVKVVNPNLREELDRAESEYHSSLFLFGLGSVLGGAVGGVMVAGEPYRYTVETADSRQIVILHKHSGFAVGDCVAVLNGQENKQASMAYGALCDEGSWQLGQFAPFAHRDAPQLHALYLGVTR